MSNKFGYFFKKCAKTKITSLTIVFRHSASAELDGEHGISHLCEHLICKSFDDLTDKFTNECITWDAYTNNNMIVFTFQGLESKLTSDLKCELVKRITSASSVVTAENLEKEKQIVIQEIITGYDDPYMGHLYNLWSNHFGFIEAGGIPDEVKNVTLKQVKEYMKAHYTQPARIVETGKTKTEFKKVTYNMVPPATPKFKFNKKYKTDICPVPVTENVYMYVMSKKLVKKTDIPVLALALDVMFSDLHSPFYQELREKRGLCYYVGASINTIGYQGILTSVVVTSKENIDEVQKIYKDVVKNVRKHFTEERFNMMVNQTLIGRELRDNMPTKNKGELIAYDMPMLPKNLETITYQKALGILEQYFYHLEYFIK